MKPRGLASLGILTALAILSACSYHAPALKVSEVRVKEKTGSGLVLAIDLEAENRNQVELPLQEVRYTVTLDSGHTFQGVRSPEASLRRLGTQHIQFPAVFAPTPEHPAPIGAVNYQISGTLDYLTPGQIAKALFDAHLRRPSVSFRGEGTLQVP